MQLFHVYNIEGFIEGVQYIYYPADEPACVIAENEDEARRIVDRKVEEIYNSKTVYELLEVYDNEEDFFEDVANIINRPVSAVKDTVMRSEKKWFQREWDLLEYIDASIQKKEENASLSATEQTGLDMSDLISRDER